MSQADDAAELQKLVGTQVPPEMPQGKRLNLNRRRTPSDLPIPCDEVAHAKDSPATVSQYSYLGGGFRPSSATVATLPSGCYEILPSEAGFYFNPVRITTDHLMVFPDTKSDFLIKEVDKFWQMKDKFDQFGFTHKRGFLLYGPAGSGKSCTLMLMAQEVLKKNGVVLVADHPNHLAHMLARFRLIEPDRPLLVIWEDIDAVIMAYGEHEVLSVLDGEAQVNKIIFIATTNYPERLDARIINRPSRFDLIVKIDLPNAEARALYLRTCLGKTQTDDGIDLVERTSGLTFAHLRELIVSVYCLDYPAEAAIERLQHMKVKPKSSELSGAIGFDGESEEAWKCYISNAVKKDTRNSDGVDP